MYKPVARTDLLGALSSLFLAILLVYISQKPFLWACVVGLDFECLTLKQPVYYRW